MDLLASFHSMRSPLLLSRLRRGRSFRDPEYRVLIASGFRHVALNRVEPEALCFDVEDAFEHELLEGGTFVRVAPFMILSPSIIA